MANRGQQRPPADPGMGMDHLADLFNRVLQNQQQPQRDRFKPPKFNGTGDVELFIQQFNDVREANGWDAPTALLQLRTCLEQSAADCGRAANVDATIASLRARFGITVRQARDRLANLRRESGQSIHALGMKASRLTALAYHQIVPAERMILAVESFKRALDNKQLNRHLLTLELETVNQVARAAEEFFQVGGSNTNYRQTHSVAAIGRSQKGMRKGMLPSHC